MSNMLEEKPLNHNYFSQWKHQTLQNLDLG
jgi:hypothetical protein